MKTFIDYGKDRLIYEIYHEISTMSTHINILKVDKETTKTLSGVVVTPKGYGRFKVLKKDLNRVLTFNLKKGTYFRVQIESKNQHDALNLAKNLFADIYFKKGQFLLKSKNLEIKEEI